jgi:transcriptional regulator with XRE-family HTH domain
VERRRDQESVLLAQSSSLGLGKRVVVTAAVSKPQKSPELLLVPVINFGSCRPEFREAQVDVESKQICSRRAVRQSVFRGIDHYGQHSTEHGAICPLRSAGAVRPVLQSGGVRGVTDKPFLEELPRLLGDRGMSLRQLAAEVGVSDSHLSRVLRRRDYKTPSTQLITKISAALGLPGDYFPEVREALLFQAIKADGTLRDRLYVRLKVTRPGGHVKSNETLGRRVD